MATGVQPRDEDPQLTRTDLENIQDALKCKKFRDLLADYCEEVRDPANQALYQKEMTQLEKERGYDVTFINPKGGYVIKTSVAGDRKAFINICSNDNVAKPSCKIEEVNGQKGANWQIPYSVIPPREDYDQKRERCVIYDVVFHPDTLRMAELNKKFREIVNKTAFDGLKKTYDIHLDNNNLRFPKSYYKGYKIPAVIRKEDPSFKPPSATDEEVEEISPEILEKLYPQHSYVEDSKPIIENQNNKEQKRKPRKTKTNEFCHTCDNGYTKPKYVIKQQKAVDMQDFTYDKNCKQYSAIPSHIVVEIYLPLLSSTKNCILDVQEKTLSLKSEKPAKYKLDILLPYPVNDDCGNAKFDKTRHMLIVTLPVVRNYSEKTNYLKIDSGVESEENSGSQSDDDNSKHKLVVELSSSTLEEKPCSETVEVAVNKDSFLEGTLGYILPPYTYNIMEDIVAFTFHVKNTEYDSVQVKKDCNKIYIKFTSIGAGFVPVHYAAIVIFDEDIQFDNVTGESWDNNVILQLEISGEIPQKFQIGLSSESMTYEYFDMSQVKKIMKVDSHESMEKSDDVTPLPAVEVTNLGTETNIVVTSGVTSEYDEDDFEDTPQEKDIVFTNAGICENGAKSILRKPMMRSFSESSAGDIASSMDYVSSDCIPEESSLKKTVRFNKVIAKQFYRYNSSIEGQKKKNQRKKNKKRSHERKSESEAEDDFMQVSKPRIKSALKERRDSGLADTSDAETECKYGHKTKDNHKQETATNNTDVTENSKSVLNIVGNNDTKHETQPTIWESETDNTKTNKTNHEPISCDNIKHNTELYDPEKLNKGQYLEVSFKNDLIFDLDM